MASIENVKHLKVKVNDINLHVVTIGEGIPLVLLHGFPDFWYGWKSIIPSLIDDYKLIIPDMRGYNLSDKPKGIQKYKVVHLIDDVLGIANFFELEDFYLAGHDWGGIVAWAFAEKYPNLLRKLMILNAPHPKIFQERLKHDKKQQSASFYIFEFLKPHGEQFVIKDDYKWLKWAVFSGMENKKDFTEEDKQRYLKAWSQPGAILSGVNYYRANLDFRDWKGIIKVPTIVLHGMKDIAVLPSVLDGLEKYVSDIQIIRVNESSHWVMHDAPELVSRTIKKYFVK